MSAASWFWSSLVATSVLTLTMSLSQRIGWSRMGFPLLIGTMVTPDRDRAAALGTGMHLLAGFALGALYARFFEWYGHSALWIGALGGALHGAFVLLVLLPILPAIHPRMASENQGPEPTRGLEPPGPFGANYGRPTPVFTFLAHVAYGALLGALYRPVS